MQSLIKAQIKTANRMRIWDIFFTIHETIHRGIPLESPQKKIEKLENVFMKHYAPNHMLAPKKGSSQKGVQLKP